MKASPALALVIGFVGLALAVAAAVAGFARLADGLAAEPPRLAIPAATRAAAAEIVVSADSRGAAEAAVAADLRTKAENAGVTISQISFRNDAPTGSMRPDLDLEGGSDEIFGFLHAVEATRPGYVAHAARLSRTAEGKVLMRLELEAAWAAGSGG
jgi:hypothetical protein